MQPFKQNANLSRQVNEHTHWIIRRSGISAFALMQKDDLETSTQRLTGLEASCLRTKRAELILGTPGTKLMEHVGRVSKHSETWMLARYPLV